MKHLPHIEQYVLGYR